MKELENKRILITAGPTWVAIDKVRVISNIATGKTGILLAKEFKKLGAKITLLLGPTEIYFKDKNIKIMRFRFFAELKNLIIRELKSKKYDVVVHSAAVADYQPEKIYPAKLNSLHKRFCLKLKPTEKILDKIKKYDPKVFLVAFKLEAGVSDATLLKRARKLLQRSNADLVVANTLDNNVYRAFIMDSDGQMINQVESRKELAKSLFKIINLNI